MLCIVEIHILSAQLVTCARRSFISPLALFVKVIASMFRGFTPYSLTSNAIRCVKTLVLPLPAPASTRICPSGIIAFACASFSFIIFTAFLKVKIIHIYHTKFECKKQKKDNKKRPFQASFLLIIASCLSLKYLSFICLNFFDNSKI